MITKGLLSYCIKISCNSIRRWWTEASNKSCHITEEAGRPATFGDWFAKQGDFFLVWVAKLCAIFCFAFSGNGKPLVGSHSLKRLMPRMDDAGCPGRRRQREHLRSRKRPGALRSQEWVEGSGCYISRRTQSPGPERNRVRGILWPR